MSPEAASQAAGALNSVLDAALRAGGEDAEKLAKDDKMLTSMIQSTATLTVKVGGGGTATGAFSLESEGWRARRRGRRRLQEVSQDDDSVRAGVGSALSAQVTGAAAKVGDVVTRVAKPTDPRRTFSVEGLVLEVGNAPKDAVAAGGLGISEFMLPPLPGVVAQARRRLEEQ